MEGRIRFQKHRKSRWFTAGAAFQHEAGHENDNNIISVGVWQMVWCSLISIFDRDSSSIRGQMTGDVI